MIINKKIKILVLLILSLASSIFADKVSTFELLSNVKVTIIESKFDKKSFNIERCSNNSSICKINGSIPFGIDLNIPKTYVKDIKIEFDNTFYTLNSKDMYNAWGDKSFYVKDTIQYFGGECFDKKHCQFRGIFSDASGSFVAEWYIIDGLPVRTILSNSNDLINLFSENINPPIFD